MKHVYQLALLLLAAGPAAAQETAPPLHLPPTSFRAGSYQLAKSGDWKKARLLYDAHSLNVSDATHKPQYPLVYSPDSVRAFVIGRDTFSVVRGVDIPSPAQHLPSLFARQMYRQAGFQVAEYVAVPAAPAPPVVYTLLTQNGQPRAVLPPSRVQFRLALAKVLRDYEPLAHQLELDPNILPEQLPELLTAYGRWKAASGQK